MVAAVLATVVFKALAGLSSPESWTSEAPELFPVAAREGRLEIGVKGGCRDGVRRIALKELVPVPEGCWLGFKALRPKMDSVRMRAIVRDAAGQEFAVWATGAYCLDRSNLFGGAFRPDIVVMSAGEFRVKVALDAFDRETCEPLGSARLPARRPLALVGFDVLPEAERPEAWQAIWLRDFFFTDASYANSSFYYAFQGVEMFGEADGDPVFSGLDVQAATWGGEHRLDWELRDSYEGLPFLQGTRLVTASPEDRPLGFAVPQETFRVREEGTYWLHLKWTTHGESFDWTARYDVFRGEPAATHEPIAEAALNPAARERLDAQARIRSEAVGAPRPLVAPAFASGESIRTGDVSLVVFAPMCDSPAQALAVYTHLFDEMKRTGIAGVVEVALGWASQEPLPGVYDFRRLDSILDAASARGIGCYVTVGTLAPPEWMPSWFTENEEGRRFGHTHYLFNGGRFNVCHHPEARRRAVAFADALCNHVKGHPALVGYFYLVEHGGDAPWRGWYEGYDEWTKAEFRRLRGSPPPRQLHPLADEPPELMRDWVDFKAESLERLQYDIVKGWRARDPVRSIAVYGSPTLGTGAFDYSGIKVITANGGCATPERGYAMTAFGELGMPQRAEEISCTDWTACGKTQLDVSFFNMMQGGGLQTHFKMFTPRGVDFSDSAWAERSGFANFRKFIPIERELRGAVRCDGELAGWTSSRGADYGEWEYETLLGSQLLVGTSVTPAWRAKKAVFVSGRERTLRRREIAELASYVAEGGTLVVTAETGSRVLEDPAARDALIAALGISAPDRPWHPDWYAEAEVGADLPWGGEGVSYRTRLRAPVKAPLDAGEALLRFSDGRHGNTPALTRKGFGKGRVYVVWAGEIIPFTRTGDAAHVTSRSFLTAIAEEAGARLPVRCDRRDIFTNLLRKGEVSYFLAMGAQDMPVEAKVALDIPLEGAEAVDLVSGERRKLPLELKMKAREVQIWRIDP